MNYLVKVGNKEVIVKPYQIKSIIDDIIIFDYNIDHNFIKNVKGIFIMFV